MKTVKGILLINLIGLSALFFCLFGGQGAEKNVSHAPIAIDENLLREELSTYPKEELQAMLHAGEEILEWDEMLAKTGSNVVDKVLKGQGVFWEMDHYPLQDTFDRETYSQYYYHAHRKGEHGHFHLFLRQGGMEEETRPLFYDAGNDTCDDIDTYAHLIAISMDTAGSPLTLFTTNRWVTGEDWYTSTDVKKMLSRFQVKHAHPSYVANRWLNAMLVLFRPQINGLIGERDEILLQHAAGIPLKQVLEDQSLEVTSERRISIETQIKVIKEILKGEQELSFYP